MQCKLEIYVLVAVTDKLDRSVCSKSEKQKKKNHRIETCVSVRSIG